MRVLAAALLFLPGIILGCLVWRKLSRPDPSLRYVAVAVASAISAFFAIQFLISFGLVAFEVGGSCAGLNGCQFQVSSDTQWVFLALSGICGVLAYLSLNYCRRFTHRK